MLQSLMNLYQKSPPRLQTFLRHWLVMPGKRLLSRGVIAQDGFVLGKRLEQSVPFHVWRHGNYEPTLAALWRHYLRPGDTFFDIGANVGYFTLLGAACVGATGRVHGFEPNPRVFAELQRNVAINQFNQVTLNNVALSNQPGNVELFCAPEMDSGLSSLRRTSGLLTETQTVRAITLDEYVAQNRVGKIRAMKLDVEGAEWLVLQGAQNLLASAHKPEVIALEANQLHADAFQVSLSTLFGLLEQNSYTLAELIEPAGAQFKLTHLSSAMQPHTGTVIALSHQAMHTEIANFLESTIR